MHRRVVSRDDSLLRLLRFGGAFKGCWIGLAIAGVLGLSDEARGQGSVESDRAVLEALYHATDGPNWTFAWNWLSDAPLREWLGVTTDDQGRVRSLVLESNSVSGSIPPELGQLANLEWLSLIENDLSGPIPPELGRLTNLEGLFLFANDLSGPIPPELGRLANLQGLGLSSNQLSGAIPPELGQLTNLSPGCRPEFGVSCYGGLSLHRNQLSGAIPPELGQLTNLRGLSLSGNQLSGAIPPELGQLTNLRELSLTGNQLSGAIPPELGRLTNLQRLELTGNQLSGAIPPELGRLTNLEYFWFQDNQLSGPIPPELGQLTNVTELVLHRNQLSGPIPAELGRLTNLEGLALSDNDLSGPIPLELGNLTRLANLLIDSDTGLCLPPAIQETAFGRLAVGNNVPLCDAAPLLTPKAPAVVQQAVNDAIAAATNGEGLRTGGAAVTVPLDALFTFPSSVARQVTYAAATFSASSTAPGVVSVSTTPDGPGVVLTPGADGGAATITVDARPEAEPAAEPVASVMFEVEVHTAVPALPAAASVLLALALLLSGAALRRHRILGGTG